MMVIAKIKNQLFEVVKVAETVQFSTEKNWVMLCSDFEQQERRKQHFKWVPASTEFTWVREFKFEG
jgi:hypothetical protein